jgi:hypothetical protein
MGGAFASQGTRRRLTLADALAARGFELEPTHFLGERAAEGLLLELRHTRPDAASALGDVDPT